MTMRPLLLSLLTMNDNNGSEAKCLPVRGPRLNASHAVGLVREPHRTQATGHMALNHTRPEPVSLQRALHGAPLAKRRRTGARCERRTTDRPLPQPVAHTHIAYSLCCPASPNAPWFPTDHAPGQQRSNVRHTLPAASRGDERRKRQSRPRHGHGHVATIARLFSGANEVVAGNTGGYKRTHLHQIKKRPVTRQAQRRHISQPHVKCVPVQGELWSVLNLGPERHHGPRKRLIS